MILAAPLVIPFAKAVGLSVGTLGMAALADKVNDFIEANPEESAMILKTLVPNLGIGEIFMNKEKISLEDLDEMTDEEAQDLSKEEKAELMKQAGKSGGKNKRQTMIDISEKLGLSGPGREKQDIEYEVDERYDEGGVEDAPKPKFDYKRFFRKADGGAIGVESLFEERVPAAPSQLVEESDMILGYRGPGGYQGGRSSRSGPSRGPAGGASAGGNYGGNRNPSQTYGGSIFRGGGGPSGGGSTKKVNPIKKIGSGVDKTLSFISPFVDPTSKLGKGLGIYNLLKKGVTTIGDTLFTPAGAAEIDFSKLPQATDPFSPKATMVTGPKVSQFEKQFPNATKKDFVDAIQSGFFGAGGTQVFEKNVGDLFEGVDLGKKGTFSFGDVSPTLIGTTDGSFRQTIDIDKEAIDPDDLEKLPGGFFKADGGRVGFNVGGITDPAALSIYNSMNAYGFSDQEIADAITAQGYDSGTLGQTTTPTTPTTPTQSEGIIGIQLNEGGGGGGSFPIGQISDTSTGFAGTGLIGDFMAANEARNRKLVQPGKIAQAAYKAGFPKQRSVQEMIESGRIDTRRSAGMPFGLSGLIAGALPDRYFDMSLGDQVFTQSQMGYDGPTVFGNQGNIGNKDPFGINVRSGFGNYADYVTNRVSELEEALEKAQKKYGGLTDEYFNMTKYMRNELKFRKAQEQVKEDQARRIEEARQNRIAEERKAGRIANQQMQRQEGGGGGGNLSRSLGISKQAAADISEANRKAGMGGYGLKDGGLASMFVEKR